MKKGKGKVFGTELTLDMYGCDLRVMKSKKKLAEFSKKMCELIGINAVGQPIIRRTGKGDLYGFSFVQFMETSSIVGHTCDPVEEVYLNIFSCKPFCPKAGREFSRKFFKAKRSKDQFLTR